MSIHNDNYALGSQMIYSSIFRMLGMEEKVFTQEGIRNSQIILRKLALQFHPDKNPQIDVVKYTKIMQKITPVMEGLKGVKEYLQHKENDSVTVMDVEKAVCYGQPFSRSSDYNHLCKFVHSLGDSIDLEEYL